MSSLTKNSAITFLSGVFTFALGIGTTVVLARTLGPTGKGIYTLIILIYSVMLRFGTFGIEVANTYFTGSKRYEIKDIASNSLVLCILLGFFLILLFYGISQVTVFHNFINSNQIKLPYLWLVILTIPFSLLSSFFRTLFLGKEEIVKFNGLNIFQFLLQLVSIIILLLIFKQGIFGAILSYVIGVIGATLFVIILIKKATEIRLHLNTKLLKFSLLYGGKAYFANLIQFLNYRLDIFLVAFFLTPAEVGLYRVAVGLAEELWMLPSAIALTLFPRISSLNETQANMLTPKVSRHTFFIIFICSIILALIGKPVIKLLLGDAFLPSVTPLLILLPGIIALGGAKTIFADLAGRGKPEFNMFASIASLATNISLNLLLIPRWGISGAAFASTVAYCLAMVIVVIAFSKITKATWSEVLLVKLHDLQDYHAVLVKLIRKPKAIYEKG